MAIIDDHPVVRAGTAAIVEHEPDLELVGVAGSVREAANLLAVGAADVLLLDLRLGEESGFSLLEAGRDGPAVIVLTSYDYPQYVDAALRLGAAGFVVKTAPVEELLDAIRKVAAGGLAFTRRPVGNLLTLSEREREVVAAVVDGLSNDEVGARLHISSKTVESHLRRLFERGQITSRTELASRAIREGWLEVPVARTAN